MIETKPDKSQLSAYVLAYLFILQILSEHHVLGRLWGDSNESYVLGSSFSLQKYNPNLPSLALEKFLDNQEIVGSHGTAFSSDFP